MYSEEVDIKCKIVDIVDECTPKNYSPLEHLSSLVKNIEIKHTSLQGMIKTLLY